MSDDNVAEVRQRLGAIQNRLEAKLSEREKNRADCISTIRFIAETVEKIAPKLVHVARYGSCSNSGVADYPNVTVKAYYTGNFQQLAEWRINAGGDYPAPIISESSIVSDVLRELDKIAV